MSYSNGDALHVVLFGTFNEGKYFKRDFDGSFDLVGFNANIVAHAPDGIAALVATLRNKKYFIDPQTHAFQQPVTTIMRRTQDGQMEVKRSIKRLAGFFGPPIEGSVGERRLTAGALEDKSMSALCNKVLRFQIEAIPEACKNLKEWEFIDYLELDLRPEFVIPPYFYLEPDNWEREVEDNIKFVSSAKKHLAVDGELDFEGQVFAELVLAKEVLHDSECIDNILRLYRDCEADGFLLWLDDFSEVDASKYSLGKYKEMLRVLSKTGKPILTKHGSFFSIALSGGAYRLLAGVGHGIEYGESRPVVPVGGGVPLAKYYFPKFHKRINYDPDAEDILLETGWATNRSTFLEKVCDCDICSEAIGSDVQSGFHEFGRTKISPKNGKAYPTADAMDKSRKHYLSAKIREYEYCKTSSSEEIKESLKNSAAEADDIKSHALEHLKRWISVLPKD